MKMEFKLKASKYKKYLYKKFGYITMTYSNAVIMLKRKSRRRWRKKF